MSYSMKTSKLVESQSPPIRRKPAPRRAAPDSEEEVAQAVRCTDDGQHFHPAPHKRAQQAYDYDESAHIDIDEEDSQMTVDEDTRFLPEHLVPTADGDARNFPQFRRTSKSGRKVDANPRDILKKPSRKPKLRATDDADGDYEDAGDYHSDVMDDEPAPSPLSESKGRAAGGARGKSSVLAGSKGKSKVNMEEKAIYFKNERKLPVKEEESAGAGSKRSRHDADATVDPNGKPGSPTSDPAPSNAPTDSAVTNEKDSEPAPKKRKLPTIKKIKNVGSASSTPGPSTKHVQASTDDVKEKEKDLTGSSTLPPLPANLPRKPAATVGNADLDLTNKDVYKQLFSHGNAPPRSGVKEKEERVRQLNKMRDEARAKRAEEAQRNSFDLQAQHDKITVFTKRLESRKSSAVWPNTLAAKFKAEHEEKIRHEGRARRSQENHHRHRLPSQQNGWTT